MNWEGAGGKRLDGEPNHRTVGEHRALCLDDREWCYPDEEMWCDCCHFANGYERVWVKKVVPL